MLVLAGLAVAAQILAAVGSGPFLTTMLIQKYGAYERKAPMLVGGVLLVATAGNILIRIEGGLLYFLQDSDKKKCNED